MKCDKLRITDDDPTSEDLVFNEGIYRIKTTFEPKSKEIQELVNSLKGIDNVIFKRHSFTATLQPKHIKKVSMNNFSYLVTVTYMLTKYLSVVMQR